MKISVVVVAFNMARELPRSLHALTAGYQRRVSAGQFEVLVVDNGSSPPLGADLAERCSPDFRYHYIDDARPSPAAAINLGVEMTDGDIVGIMIDGARIVTPGVLAGVFDAFRMFATTPAKPVVIVPGFHLGSLPQQDSVSRGYSPDVEDKLLEQIEWPASGYRLFEIATPDMAWHRGCLSKGAMVESTAVFVGRDHFAQAGGYDTAFDEPGGGLANPDFLKRIADDPDVRVVVPFCEGSFHQVHGGVSTNVARAETMRRSREWKAHYHEIRGEPWAPPRFDPIYIGKLVRPALDYLAWSAHMAPPETTDVRHSSNVRYPVKIRDYLAVLHDREAALGNSLHASELDLAQIRRDLDSISARLGCGNADAASVIDVTAEAEVLRAENERLRAECAALRDAAGRTAGKLSRVTEAGSP